MDKYTTLINLITCTGVLMLISLIVMIIAIRTAGDYPDSDGERM